MSETDRTDEEDGLDISDDAHRLLLEANNHEAKRKEVAKAFREYVLKDTTRWKENKLTSSAEVERWIPTACNDHDVLFRFALSRSYDFPSASKRFYKFCALLNSMGMTDLISFHPDYQKMLQTGIFHLPSAPDQHGRPVMNMICKTFSWDGITIKQMQFGCLWAMWRVLMAHGYAAQTIGISGCCYFDGMSMGMIKMEFETWISKVWQEMLPMKLGAFYFADDPWAFRNVMWPMMKSVFKKKIRERVYWLNDTEQPKKGLTKKYHKLHEDYPPDLILTTHGGTYTFDPKAHAAELELAAKKEQAAKATAIIQAAMAQAQATKNAQVEGQPAKDDDEAK